MVTTADRSDLDVRFHAATAYHGKLLQHCQAILGRLNWPGASGPRTLGVTSCLGGEGVSTVAAHVAATAASSGNGPILLVDTNRSRPSVHQTFGVPPGPGLLGLLQTPDPWEKSVRQTSVTGLSVLAAGPVGLDVVHALDLEAFSRVLKQLSAHFSLVMFDMPPASPGDWTQHLARRLDGIVLVVQSERIRCEVAQRTLENLQRAGANVVGTVLNKRPQHIPEWLYQKL